MTEPAKKQPKDLSGAVFKNDRRTKDTQPHWTGKLLVNGKEYRVSMWERKDHSGADMMSIALTDPATLPPRPITASSSASPAYQNQNQNNASSGGNGAGEDDIFQDLFGSLGS